MKAWDAKLRSRSQVGDDRMMGRYHGQLRIKWMNRIFQRRTVI